jgi:hypothetical protein
MRQPLVSIMMPAFNAAPYIGTAIESALAQDFDNWELIIVDDGSTDGTGTIGASYPDSRIQVIAQANAGEAIARNTALAAMSGRYVAFLDADDAFLPNHLRLMVDRLESDPELGGVYTDGFHCDEEGTHLGTLSSRRRGPFQSDLFDPLVRASDVFGPPLCVLLRRDRILQHDLRWDPAIVIGPDWDFFIRYAQFATFDYIAEHTCLYRVHTSNITVRTGPEKRRAALALCREKTIGLPRFPECSEETRAWVFYELLVELLDGQPEKQGQIVAHPGFLALPAIEQARLLRLMASRAIRSGSAASYIGDWLTTAHSLAPTDSRIAALSSFYHLSPSACRLLLRARNRPNDRADMAHPLADLLRPKTEG